MAKQRTKLRQVAPAGAALALGLALTGCASVLTETTSDVAGIAGAGAASAVTKSAALATGIGLGIQSSARFGLQFVERDVHGAEQDRIAQAAGPLPVGGVAGWSVHHRIPIEANEHGEVTVTRVLGGGAMLCKDIIFSVNHTTKRGTRRAFYTASVCRDGPVWRWATAEPATARWGALQ
jgi:hypothetical protein